MMHPKLVYNFKTNILKIEPGHHQSLSFDKDSSSEIDGFQAAKDVSRVLHMMTMSNQLRAVNSFRYPAFNPESNRVINDGKVEYAVYTGGLTNNSQLITNPTNNNPDEKFVYILNDECYVLRIDCLYYRSDGEIRLTTNDEYYKLVEEYISTYKISKENVKITTSTFILDAYIIYQTTHILEPDYCYLHLYKINKNDLIEFENWKKRCSAIK